MCIAYITQSRQEHRWTPPDATDAAVRLVAVLFGNIMVRIRSGGVPLGHLDGGFLVDAEEGNVGNPDEGPFLVGPEHDDGSSLRGLGRYVKIGEADAAQIGSQTNEDVPSTV